MRIVPITLQAAKDFIREHHRHNKPPLSWKFGVGLADDAGALIGVATCGRPVARAYDDGLCLEINRSCTLGDPNANSKLYGACRQIARAMGYARIITYTQADESGASLRASGFVRVKELPGRGSWAHHAVSRTGRDETGGGVARVLWEVRFSG